MNYVESFNLLGVEAKQISCIKGNGAPTESTEGAVGCFYMDVDTGDVYKCTSVDNGVYTWGLIGGGGATEQIQSDWNQADNTQPDFIKNKPDVYTKTEIDDKLINLPSGDGSLELQDIRIGTDGTVYNTAGEAVRSQVKDIEELVNEKTKSLSVSFENENIFDEENDSVYAPNSSSDKIGTVFLEGTEGFVIISTKNNYRTYISSIKLYDDSDTVIDGIYTTDVLGTGLTRTGKKVSIPSNARKLEFKYKITSTSIPVICSEMMVTVGETLPTYYVKSARVNVLLNSPYVTKQNVMRLVTYYVSTTGDDENDGLSKETPFKTVAKAVSLGATNIAIKRGEYPLTEIVIENKSNIHIYAYGDDEYSHDVPKREKARLVGGIYHTDYSLNSDGIYHCSDVETFNRLILIDDEESKMTELTQATSYDACVSTEGTYFLNGTDLYFNTNNETFEKIVISKCQNVFVLKNCNNVLIEDISFEVSSKSVVDLDYCLGVVFNNCEANYSAAAMGFSIDYSNAVLNNCLAYRNNTDGFNFHGYGTTVMNDCVSKWNGDDGCSHHGGCTGTINGGSFIGNGKAGIAPAYGANVNIYNAICDQNDSIGIGYLSTTNGHASMKGIINGCVMANNKTGLLVGNLCDVVAVNCIYKDNTVNNKKINGTLIEY